MVHFSEIRICGQYNTGLHFTNTNVNPMNDLRMPRFGLKNFVLKCTAGCLDVLTTCISCDYTSFYQRAYSIIRNNWTGELDAIKKAYGWRDYYTEHEKKKIIIREE